MAAYKAHEMPVRRVAFEQALTQTGSKGRKIRKADEKGRFSRNLWVY